MKTPQQLKELADGKNPKQLVTFVVKAHGQIIPTVVFNVYININCSFVHLMTSMDKPKTSIVSANPRSNDLIPVNLFLFATTVENYKKTFGFDYKSGHILEFHPPTKEG